MFGELRVRSARAGSSELVGGGSDAAHADSPRLAAREQLVRVDLVCPAEEVQLGIVLRAAVDGRVLRRRILRQDPALDLLGSAPRLFRGGAFHVATRHSGTVPDALAVRNLQKRYGSVQALRGVDLVGEEGQL